jgi:hypothetical protein
MVWHRSIPLHWGSETTLDSTQSAAKQSINEC